MTRNHVNGVPSEWRVDPYADVLPASSRPAPLRPGDTIGICAPSGSVADPARVPLAAKAIEALGFKVCLAPGCAESYGYLAGTDAVRARDLNALFADPEVKGIFCLKGGYGTPRILNSLDWNLIRNNPKALIGYSDITALHLGFFSFCSLATFHGPMPSSDMLPDFDPFSAASLLRAIGSTEALGEIGNTPGRESLCIQPGIAEGPILGGNLSLVVATLGSPWQINAKGAILFLEDIDEAPYRIDRMLTQLLINGVLDDCAGIVLGDWNNCVPGEGKKSLTLEQVFKDILPSNKPILANLGVGHCTPKLTLPLGIPVRLDAAAHSLKYLEPATV